MTKAPDILQAMNGPFRPWFNGASWDSWRAILKATAALPMNDADIEFFQSVAGGREPPRRRVREAWYVCGRRAGKDSVVSLIAAHAAATFNPKGVLRPGERALIACIAPDKETAKIVQRYITAFFETVPSLKAMIQRTTDEVLELRNMVDIQVMTSNFRTVRGRPILCCILDEVALLRSDLSAAPDVELYNALLPGMATIPQAMMFGISSPYRKSGLLYKKWVDHFGRDGDDVLVVQAPSHVMNPLLDTRDRDRQMAEDPAAARAEWYGEFRDDLVAFIDPATVARAVVTGRTELPPVPGIRYFAAVDPSGGSSDSMTLAIAHLEGERGILDVAREWVTPFSPEQVTNQIVEVCRGYNLKSVTGDRFGGEWPRERFRLKGIEYQLAAFSRSEAYLALLPSLNTPGKIELLDNTRLIAQLSALERRTARSGRDTVDHPRGGHDDIINAAALALVGVAAQPNNSAANWIEYLRREAVRAGIEVDDIRAAGPQFGFEIGPAKQPEPLFKLWMPKPVENGGGRGGVMADHKKWMPRYEGERAYLDVPRAAAIELLEHPLWLDDNKTVARDLGREA